MTEIDELKAKIKELEKENKRLKADLKKKDKALMETMDAYNQLNNSFVQKNADYIELKQLRTSLSLAEDMKEMYRKEVEREKKINRETKKEYKILEKKYQVAKAQLESINTTDSNINKQSYELSETTDYICIAPQMQPSEIENSQAVIAELNELLKKLGITMNLSNENVFICFFNREKMKKIAVRNKNGAKKKIPKTDKPFGEYLTYDDVKEMMKEQTAEQVASKLGFTKMTLYRKLKQAEQRENKLFY